MAKNVAPPKVTSGGGFNFEEKVIAYYSIFLLNGECPFRMEDGNVERIDMQVRVDGWLLDDMLITLRNSENVKRVCFSIKSNQQFSGCKAPEEFVNLAWEQFLINNKGKFDKEKDGIGLIISSLPNDVHQAIQDVLNFSRTMSSDMLASRLKEDGFTNDCVREMFDSFQCPTELAGKYGVTDKNIGDLLKSIYIIEFDFEENISRKQNEAISLISNILKSGSKKEAELLWSKLIEIVTETKRAGYINHDILINRLTGKFYLQEYPSHKADWVSIKKHTIENIEVINDKIGFDIFVPREKVIHDLINAILNHRLTILSGASGTGKTVLAKQLCRSKIENGQAAIWLDAEYLNRGSLDDFQNSLKLNYPLNELFIKSSDEKPVLIIDKLDRVYDDLAFRNISIILREILVKNIESRWNILMILQSDELNRVVSKLLNNNLSLVNYKVHEIGNPAISEYKALWEKYPEMYKFIIRNKSGNLLLKPKILDIIVQNVSTFKKISESENIGETEIVDWIWENHVRKGKHSEERASFVMQLAEMQALAGKSLISKSEFSISDQAPLNSLVHDKICLVKDEKISFAHNLFSDWSLYRLLISNDQDINTYLENKKDSPFWVRPLRLYFIRIIDKESSLDQWLSKFHNFEGTILLQDIMLDAIFFSVNSLLILEKLWTDFLSKNSDVFRRLLKRFLYVATFPDPFYMLLFKSDKSVSESELATFKRVPNYIYWPPVLKFLHNHLNEVIKMDLFDIAQISDSWLRDTEPKYIMRMEAAELAINIAEYMLGSRLSPRTLIEEKLEETAYRCGLAACNEYPNTFT